MENVVSARRLRKSMMNSTSIDMYSLKKEERNFQKKKISFIDKLLIRCVISSFILFVTITVVNLYGSKLVLNENVDRLYNHYKYDFSLELILNNFEESIRNINKVMGEIIPKKVKEGIVSIYYSYLKPFLLNFNVYYFFSNDKNNEVEIYLYNENNLVGNENILKEENITTEIEMNIENIPKILPTIGVITSSFGEREKIFDELSTNHTGIDIANVLGTDIVSSTSGVVSKVRQNDKYYGNFIEINSYGIIFKYAHLNEILVKENDIVNQGDLIAKMGTTGMSTGPHLHFEVIVNGKAIDPESIMKFR